MLKIEDIEADLTTTNELGDGSREYESRMEGLYVTCYDDPEDGQKVTGRYVVRFEVENVGLEPDTTICVRV